MSTDPHTLSGAYVLHALSLEEAAEFEQHLEQCDACREEVRELREAAAQMAISEAMAPPPSYLRARVLDAADKLPQLPPQPTPIERARSTRWSQRLLVAAAALVVVVASVIGISQTLDDEADLPAAVSQVFESPDVRTTAVSTDHGTIRVAASPGRNQIALDTRDLASLEGNAVYQVWSLVDATATSAGVLEDTTAGVAMPMPRPGASMAITIEPAGGSKQPTSQPFVRLNPRAI
jgi:anti-sigma-K factor RskA